jgi:hypothetical protein
MVCARLSRQCDFRIRDAEPHHASIAVLDHVRARSDSFCQRLSVPRSRAPLNHINDESRIAQGNRERRAEISRTDNRDSRFLNHAGQHSRRLLPIWNSDIAHAKFIAISLPFRCTLACLKTRKAFGGAYMSTRLVPVLFLLLVVLPASTQQTMPTRAREQTWAERNIRPEPPAQVDVRAARILSIHRDGEELSALNLSVESQLQELRKGMLPKDLAQNLKKMEKLSKRLRQEVER